VSTAKSTLFAVSKDEWDTKEGTGTLEYIICAAKDTSQVDLLSG